MDNCQVVGKVCSRYDIKETSFSESFISVEEGTKAKFTPSPGHL